MVINDFSLTSDFNYLDIFFPSFCSFVRWLNRCWFIDFIFEKQQTLIYAFCGVILCPFIGEHNFSLSSKLDVIVSYLRLNLLTSFKSRYIFEKNSLIMWMFVEQQKWVFCQLPSITISSDIFCPLIVVELRSTTIIIISITK